MVTATTSHEEAPADTCVMIASPSREFRQYIQERIGNSFGRVTEAVGGADVLGKLDETPCRYLILDRHLADLNTDELQGMLHGLYSELEIILLDSETAIENLAPHSGAVNTARPPEKMAAHNSVPKEEERAPAVEEPEERRDRAEPLPGMIGSSRAMDSVFRLARLVARRNTPVLVMGQTGTGKELVARAVHDLSPRAAGPFITVNCAAIPETLIEAELFGHSRGAFTGAVQSRLGRIHAAHGGTLFLDEAGELSLSMQAKLLRFLQHGEVQRLGSSDVFRVDVRVVAATNADLAARVERGEFRVDLYYRLSVFPIELPPLKEHVEDVVPLALHHLETLCREESMPEKTLTQAAQALLRRHSWPGNVRELQHAVERAFILAQDRREISASLFRLSPGRALP